MIYNDSSKKPAGLLNSTFFFWISSGRSGSCPFWSDVANQNSLFSGTSDVFSYRCRSATAGGLVRNTLAVSPQARAGKPPFLLHLPFFVRLANGSELFDSPNLRQSKSAHVYLSGTRSDTAKWNWAGSPVPQQAHARYPARLLIVLRG